MHDETVHLCGHDHAWRPGADAEAWDAFYSGRGDGAPQWSGQPNGSLVTEVAGLDPGTALDVGCGEGADAIWLAQRGWTVTALDPSAIALRRAVSAAAESEVTVAWLQGGLMETRAELDTFDLVTVHYGVLPLDEVGAGIDVLCRAVAPGGTLLVVHHELDPAHHNHDAFGGASNLMPDEVAAHLRDGWRIETHERRERSGVLRAEAGHPRDIVLRALRADASGATVRGVPDGRRAKAAPTRPAEQGRP